MPEPALHNLFPTPLLQWQTDEEDLRKALLRDVLLRRTGERAIGAERVAVSCFERSDPQYEPLSRVIHTALKSFLELNAGTENLEMPRYTVKGAARLLNRDDYVEVRDSGQADVSGVFYLDLGDGAGEEFVGFLEFIDPRVAVKMLPGRRLSTNARIHPRPGLLLLYPGWAKRLFYPYEGEKPRIVLEFDLRFGPSDGDADWTGARG